MEPTSVDYTWNLGNEKFRDGRYGPIFSGLVDSTAKLLTVEVLEESDSRAAQSLISHLNKQQMVPIEPHPYIVTYLGFQQKAEGVCLLWEWEGGGTMQDFIQQHGAIEQDLMRIYLGRLATGLEALQKRGFATVFLDSGNILLASGMDLKIEPPILDVSVTGCALPPGVLTLPELILDGPLPRNMRKADVWLLGIVAAEALSGTRLTAALARRITAQVQEKERGSAWELFVPHDVAEKLDTPALDFLRQCFIVDLDQRPSAADLRKHPFLSEEAD